MIKKDYSDIIDMPHHTSKVHPRMSMHERSAQFSPFRALTGHEEAISETSRIVDKKLELDEYQLATINRCLNEIKDHIKSFPEVIMVHFVKDTKKDGGIYLTIAKKVKKIDDYEKYILFQDGTKVKFEDIYNIELTKYEG